MLLRQISALAMASALWGTLGRDVPAEPPESAHAAIVPVLTEHCFGCHAGSEREGNFSFDEILARDSARQQPDVWWKVLKNVRSGVMPPATEPKISSQQIDALAEWIKSEVFQINISDPDPGRSGVRRLNRSEYGNTVRDLMGVPFDAALIFPPDDSGHGFDNLSDAMTFSPLLMEKYLQAARLVVEQAVPKVTKIIPRQEFSGSDFTDGPEKSVGNSLDGKVAARLQRRFAVDEPGVYSVRLTTRLHGTFDFDPARYAVAFRVDGQLRSENEYGWDENKRHRSEFEESFETGQHTLEIQLTPIPSKADEKEKEKRAFGPSDPTGVRFEITSVAVEGPKGTSKRVHPFNYERFFSRDEPPEADQDRHQYAAEVLERFATNAFRGPVDSKTIQRLADITQSAYSRPGMTFEAGVGEAMVSVLASPRFLFRTEPAPAHRSNRPYGPIDQRTLAARLSYFLWSTMPDEELFRLADAGQLHAQLSSQVTRMMADERSQRFIDSFVGQWLRTRDVTQTSIDPIAVLGHQEEYDRLREQFRSRFRRRGFGEALSEEDQKARDRFRELRDIADRFNADLKRAIRRETEMSVEHVIRDNRNVLELIDCDYAFLNEKLAQHYGIEGVEGSSMRKVTLPKDSPRGGILTQASMLIVTSNPGRTSPVKRGMFVLDNILGTPAPPAPGAVPELEDSAAKFEGTKPTLRQMLAAHREAPLCASCHARMDPLGLALENFNALGMWRTSDNDQLVDASGTLITGESFTDIRQLKQILRKYHAQDFYRCLTQKLLTFAIGRGLEYSDEHSIDLIVQRLSQNDGRFQELLMGVIESAPFQKQRYPNRTALP